MPNGLPHANQIMNVEQVRSVCNPWGTLLVAAELLWRLWLLSHAAMRPSPLGLSRLAPSLLAPVVIFPGASASFP